MKRGPIHEPALASSSSIFMNLLSWFRRRSNAGDLRGSTSDSDPGQQRVQDELQRRIGYRFQDSSLLERALTHRSFLYDSADRDRTVDQDYEALEFFGDSVVGLVISEHLLSALPGEREGTLSKLRARLVSTEQLSALAGEIGLGEALRLSSGEERSGGRRKRAILADAFESVTAAIYLDGGLETARRFVLQQFRPYLDQVRQSEFETGDYKSALQERLHAMGLAEPSYEVVEESGPDHRKSFRIRAIVQEALLAEGVGRSKKAAEQEAAQKALSKIEKDEVELPAEN